MYIIFLATCTCKDFTDHYTVYKLTHYPQVVLQALMSLPKIYLNRNLPADQLRKQNVLSLSQAPQLMLQPTLSGNLPCEFLSLETIHRWILCE